MDENVEYDTSINVMKLYIFCLFFLIEVITGQLP